MEQKRRNLAKRVGVKTKPTRRERAQAARLKADPANRRQFVLVCGPKPTKSNQLRTTKFLDGSAHPEQSEEDAFTAPSRMEVGRLMRELRQKGHGSRWLTDAPRAMKLHYQATGVTSGVTAQFGSYEFQLDQFEGYATPQALFDAYRLLKVELQFIPKVNIQSLTTKAVVTTNQVPALLIVKDYDDSTPLSTQGAMLEYDNCEVHDPFKPFKVTVIPRVSAAVFAGGVTNGYAQEDSDLWLDIANDDIEHYGIKWSTGSTNGSQTTFQEWFVFVTGWFEFRQPR